MGGHYLVVVMLVTFAGTSHSRSLRSVQKEEIINQLLKEFKGTFQADKPKEYLENIGLTRREVYERQARNLNTYSRNSLEQRQAYAGQTNETMVNLILDYKKGYYVNVKISKVNKDGSKELAQVAVGIDCTDLDNGRTVGLLGSQEVEPNSKYEIEACWDTARHPLYYAFPQGSCEYIQCLTVNPDPETQGSEKVPWSLCDRVKQ